MVDSLTELLDPTRILFDLQNVSEIAQTFAGCLEPTAIAHQATTGLVERFDCAFARIWLLEPETAILKLVASSGLYTHTDGFFSRIPMGAYKVGKIAQNRVSFLSNNLAAEPWVGNREWAIANNIRGFAGYPLTVNHQVIGVLAVFSHHSLEPEFLEALQILCTVLAIALDTALTYQQERQTWQVSASPSLFTHLSLSEQLVSILRSTRLTLMGTEQPLSLPVAYVFLRAAERLNAVQCSYGRLIYTAEAVTLEAIVPTSHLPCNAAEDWINANFGDIVYTLAPLGGQLQTQVSVKQRAVQVVLSIPYGAPDAGIVLRVDCRLPVLQLAFSQLAWAAGLRVCPTTAPHMPLLTDDRTQLQSTQPILWIRQGSEPVPQGIKAVVDVSITPEQLRQAVEAVRRGDTWGVDPEQESLHRLSERELEIFTLLTQGDRDRDIAEKLIISESTVKFHINNVLTKLKARTRYQAIHQAIVNGWIR